MIFIESLTGSLPLHRRRQHSVRHDFRRQFFQAEQINFIQNPEKDLTGITMCQNNLSLKTFITLNYLEQWLPAKAE